MSLAGWLFADLLLLLFVLFLALAVVGSTMRDNVTRASASPSPTAAPSATVPPPSPTAPPITVHKESYCMAFNANLSALVDLGSDPDERAAAQDEVRARLRERLGALRNSKAAFVITFGTAESVGRGQALAKAVNEILVGKVGASPLPGVFDSSAEPRNYGYEPTNKNLAGKVSIEVFLLTSEPVPSPLPLLCPPDEAPVH